MLTDLELPILQGCRRDRRLQFMHRVVEESVPVIPPEHFLQPQRPTKQRVQSKRFPDCVAFNIFDRLAANNSRCCGTYSPHRPVQEFLFCENSYRVEPPERTPGPV